MLQIICYLKLKYILAIARKGLKNTVAPDHVDQYQFSGILDHLLWLVKVL